MPGQLNLFKGKRQRGTNPPSSREFVKHCVIADLLRRWCNPQWRYTHLPMGEKRSSVTAGRLKRMGVTKGWPDFLFVGPTGVFWLELKAESGELTDEQEELRVHLIANGHGYLCTKSVPEAVAWLKTAGILRASIISVTGK